MGRKDSGRMNYLEGDIGFCRLTLETINVQRSKDKYLTPRCDQKPISLLIGGHPGRIYGNSWFEANLCK